MWYPASWWGGKGAEKQTTHESKKKYQDKETKLSDMAVTPCQNHSRHPTWSKDRFCLTVLSELMGMYWEAPVDHRALPAPLGLSSPPLLNVHQHPVPSLYHSCNKAFYDTINLLPIWSCPYHVQPAMTVNSTQPESCTFWQRTVRPVHSIKLWNLGIWHSGHVSIWTPDKDFQFSDYPGENSKHRYSSEIK